MIRSIRLIDRVGAYCVGSDCGEILRTNIEHLLNDKQIVSIDFTGVLVTTSAFLNTLYGQLFKTYSQDFINKYVIFSNVSEDDIFLIESIKSSAIKYYTDPNYRKTIDDIMENLE